MEEESAALTKPRDSHKVRLYFLFAGVGLIIGPVLLTALQSLEYTVYHFVIFEPIRVTSFDLFRQYIGPLEFTAFTAFGAFLGSTTGWLICSGWQRDLVALRWCMGIGVSPALIAGVTTVFAFDPESFIWGMGAPELQVWTIRIAFNVPLKWAFLLFVVELNALNRLRHATKSFVTEPARP
jgi:hypothetical protein